MATLKALRVNIESGQWVVARNSDEYVAAYMYEGEYVSVHSLSRLKFSTFDELLSYLEPDADGLTEKELDHWDIETDPTETEKARWQPLVAAINDGDEEAIEALIKDGWIKHLETALFQGSIKPQMRKQMVAYIARLHTTI